MKILITGGSGFIGTFLCRYLLEKGHEVTALGTRTKHSLHGKENFSYVTADTGRQGEWQQRVAGHEILINLAGKTIARRWSDAYKKEIRDSRILTTRNLVEALPEKSGITLCSASAVGYYGDQGDALVTEATPAGNDFLAHISQEWEQEALQAQAKGGRVVITRFGVVFGPKGGALEQMIPAYRYFAGGPLGQGSQWFSWIHLADLVAALLFVIENPEISGPLNFIAPNPVRQRELAKALGRHLNRPAVMPTPAFMLRLVMGEMAQSLLQSQRVVPEKLTHHGFRFKFPDIESTLTDLI